MTMTNTDNKPTSPDEQGFSVTQANVQIDRTIKKLIYEDKPKSSSQNSRLKRIAETADRLYEFIPDECWMTEKNLARALGVSLRQIQYAKSYLSYSGRVLIEERPNGKRKNCSHRIRKFSLQTKEPVERPTSTINWTLFNELSVTSLNELSWDAVLDIFQEMNLPYIPIHFPKFDKKGSPFCSCRLGRSCPNPAKHPVVRYKHLDFTSASAFREMKAHWTDKGRRFNVALLTDGFTVIDVDRRHGGHYSLEFLEEEYGEIPRELTVETGNGFHLYTSERLTCQVNILGLPGIDLRSAGGYIIAPFSVHPSGRKYCWRSLAVPDALPPSLAVDLQTRHGGSADNRSGNSNGSFLKSLMSADNVAGGTRNDKLFRAAAAKRGMGGDERDILEFIKRLNQTKCADPVTDRELERIARSAMRYPTNAQKNIGLRS